MPELSGQGAGGGPTDEDAKARPEIAGYLSRDGKTAQDLPARVRDALELLCRVEHYKGREPEVRRRRARSEAPPAARSARGCGRWSAEHARSGTARPLLGIHSSS